uniref:Ribonuclease H-like domain-containing protein n=1 Tax=Tanacetum cinerariifolium TaxID=118510 RepID=A0A6L2P0D5_TANCI|nr:ribonuclease H-like domain-containing protein [Tanacetum cinerariifolium]
MHDPREPHLNAMKHVLCYLRGTTDLGLQYFGLLHHGLFPTLMLAGQDTLSRSSAEAEYRGVANAVAETSWIRNLLHELHTPLFTATLVYCDNVAFYPELRFVKHCILLKPNGEALRKCIMSGPYKPTTVLVQAVEATDDSPAILKHTTVETPMNMSPENKAHFLAEKEAIQTAQEMWEAIERVKDSAYHKEKMLLCKQAKQGVPLQTEEYDWLADTDEEVDEHELEAHYSYMAKIQEVPTADSSTDSEPVEQVQNDAGYNVFANGLQHYEQFESVSNTCLVEMNDKIDELESDKAEFSDMYDVILQECVSKDVMCSYLMSLSNLDAPDELQCLYLHKVKECDCLAQKLSKQTESVSKKVHIELLQRFAKVEKHSISLEISLQKCKEQVKNDPVCNEKASNVFRKEREQYFEIQDLKAQLQDKNIAISELKKLIEKGKPAPFSNSLERIYFSKTKSVPKTNVSEGLSKPVTAHTLPQTVRQAKSVIACKDSLNSRTLNDNAVCATCNKCVVDSNHFDCVTKMLNDVNARTKKPNVVPISTRKPKSQANKSVKTHHKKHVASKPTIQKPQSYFKVLYENTSKAWKWWIERQSPSGYKWVPKPKVQWYMTGNLKLLCNFVEKFLGTVRFGNDQFVPILSYGDLVQGNVTINKVYYVEGLNHNLFSVGQFCDADLEVAFRKSTCFVRDL